MNDIVRTYQQQLYHYLRRMLSNSEDAKDVLQNTWIQVYAHLDEVQHALNQRAYIYRIATNCAYMWLRDEKAMDSIEEVDEQVLRSIPSEVSLPMGSELLVRLEHAVLRLPAQQRAVFVLHYHEDMDYEHIAEITGSTPNAAKVNYSLAKSKISRWLTAGIASLAVLLTLSIGVERWGFSEPKTQSDGVVYASDQWMDFAEDDVWLME